MARSRHRDDSDDTDTDEIEGRPHRKYDLKLNTDGEMQPDPHSWRECKCPIGTNHT